MKQIIGTFLFPSGLPISGGTVKFLLSQDALSSDGQIAPVPQYTVLDSNGSIITSPPFELECQDELNPSGTYYTVTVSVPNRGIVYGPELFSLVGTSPINIDNIIPLPGRPRVIVAPTTGVSSLNSLLGDLTIEAGANVTVSEVGQNIVIASTASSTGTVTSVALVDNTGLFTVTGSPVTTSGSLTLSALASQTQNTFLAAPNGSNGAPTFRGIAAADIPAIAESQVTNLVSDLGAKAPTANPVLTGFVQLGNSASVNSATDPGAGYLNVGAGFRIADSAAASGHYLRGNGAHYVDGTIQAGDVPVLNQSTSGTSGGLTGTPAIVVAGITCTAISLSSGDAISWNGDTGISRDSAGVIDVGNGTAGDKSGTVNCAGIANTGSTVTNNLFVTSTSAIFGTTGIATGTITLKGVTSGTCSISAPAIAGTVANAIAISNSINLPSGTSISWNSDTFISRFSANELEIGNAVGDHSGFLTLGTLIAATEVSTPLFVFNGADTGFSRISAGVAALGNGTASSTTGTLDLTTLNAFGGVSIGVAGTTSGVLTLEGSTSGSCTITAPATAGTSTNPITISNSLQLPSGTALSWNGDVGISRSSAQNLLFGNGTAGNSACNVTASTFNIGGNSGTFSGSGINWVADTGLWRASAGVIEVGGGTASATGTINATTANFTGTTTTSTLAVTGLMTEYNGVSTVGQGIASIYAQTNLLLQGANIGATTMFAVPASGAGIYRIHVYLVVTRAGTTSTLPDSRITYTDQDSGAVITVPVTTMSTGNALTTFSTATIDINAKASTNVQFDVGQVNAYASTGGTTMQFAYRNRLEYLG